MSHFFFFPPLFFFFFGRRGCSVRECEIHGRTQVQESTGGVAAVHGLPDRLQLLRHLDRLRSGLSGERHMLPRRHQPQPLFPREEVDVQTDPAAAAAAARRPGVRWSGLARRAAAAAAAAKGAVAGELVRPDQEGTAAPPAPTGGSDQARVLRQIWLAVCTQAGAAVGPAGPDLGTFLDHDRRGHNLDDATAVAANAWRLALHAALLRSQELLASDHPERRSGHVS